MSILGLFSSPDKVIEKGFDLAGRATGIIDKIWHTDQEKAEDAIERTKLNIRISEGVLKFVETTQDESSIRSKTRRVLAWSIIGLSAFLTLYFVFISTLVVLWTSKATQLESLADNIILALKYWSYGTGAVITFYFGYYAASNVIGKWNEGKKNDNPKPKKKKKKKKSNIDDEDSDDDEDVIL